MNNKIHSSQMLALLIYLFCSTLFSAPAMEVVSSADALWISAILTGLIGAVICFFMVKLSGGVSYFDACAATPGLTQVFGLLLGCLFALMTAGILKSLVDMTKSYILPLTPRPVTMFVVVSVMLVGGFYGIASISRMVRFVLPLALFLVGVVMLFSIFGQAHFNNIFPLFGNGPERIIKNGLDASICFIWVLVLLIDIKTIRKPGRVVQTAVIISALVAALGYFGFLLLNPQGAPSETSYPLQQIASLNGYSRFFQRMRSLFTFVWVPTFTASAAAGLCYSARSFARAFNMDDPRPLLFPLTAIIICFSAPLLQEAPYWYSAIMAKNPWFLLVIVLSAVPYVVYRIRHKEKGGQETCAKG